MVFLWKHKKPILCPCASWNMKVDQESENTVGTTCYIFITLDVDEKIRMHR